MGHIGVKGLGQAVQGLEYSEETPHTCEICAQANIMRRPFPRKSYTWATRRLGRVHSDVCGPLPPCWNNYQYFTLIIDDYSDFVVVFFMKLRSEIPKVIKQYVEMAERLVGEKVGIMCVDNAPEYVHGELRRWADEKGISFEITVPDSPSQNSKSERHMLTFGRMGRAQLLDGGLSEFFWPFSIQSAVHIKNRVPHSDLPPNTTPYE